MAESFLSSALDTYVGLRNENRKSQLHELQVEYGQLRNSGARMENRFYRDTYDNRVEEQDAITRTRASQAETQEALGPLQILHQKLQNKGQSLANTGQSHQNRRLNADATVAERTIDSRVDRSVGEADKAMADAQEAQFQARTAAITSGQEDLFRLLPADPTDGDLLGLTVSKPGHPNRSPAAMAAGKVIQATFEEELGRGEGHVFDHLVELGNGNIGVMVRRTDGQVHPRTENGTRAEDPEAKSDLLFEVTPSQYKNFILNRSDVGDMTTRTAQEGVIGEEVAAQAQAGQADLDNTATQAQNTAQAADARWAAAQELTPQIEALEGEIAALSEQVAKDDTAVQQLNAQGGITPNTQADQRRARLAELEAELTGLTEQAEGLGALGYTLTDYADDKAPASITLANLPEARARVNQQARQQFAAGTRQLDTGETTATDVASNLRQTGRPAQSMADLGAEAEARVNRSGAAAKPVVAGVDNAVKSIADKIDKASGKDKARYPDFSRGTLRADLLTLVSDNARLADMAVTDPVRFEATMGTIANGMAEIGSDRGAQTFMFQGNFGGSPELAFEVMSSPALKDAPKLDKYLVGNLASVYAANGMGEGQAKMQALQALSDGKLRSAEDLTSLAKSYVESRR